MLCPIVGIRLTACRCMVAWLIPFLWPVPEDIVFSSPIIPMSNLNRSIIRMTAFMTDGSFVTSEKGIERIKVYGPDGIYKYLVASPDSFEEGTRGLDLAVDSQERILVLDPVKKKVRIFVKK